jgi:DNA-binding NarL/FixJ family response regulator
MKFNAEETKIAEMKRMSSGQQDRNKGEQIRILIADDHAVVRRGLALVLRQEPDFLVAGEAADGQTAVSQTLASRPDLVLLDWKMPGIDGLAAAHRIKQEAPATQILMLSGAPVETAVLDALSEDVDGFVHKDVSPAGLAHAIRVVAGGKRFLGPEISELLLLHSRRSAPPAPGAAPSLSPRELDVLRLMATPATYREMGEHLFIGEETVRTYVKRIFKKLELDNPSRTQAVIAGLRLGLIEID